MKDLPFIILFLLLAFACAMLGLRCGLESVPDATCPKTSCPEPEVCPTPEEIRAHCWRTVTPRRSFPCR